MASGVTQRLAAGIAILAAGCASEELDPASVLAAEIECLQARNAVPVGKVQLLQDPGPSRRDRLKIGGVDYGCPQPRRPRFRAWGETALRPAEQAVVVKLREHLGHTVFVDTRVRRDVKVSPRGLEDAFR